MQTGPKGLDPIRLEVYRHLFTALAEEMGAALRRAAHSPNIKERRDYSCALFDGAGRVVAMGDHMPVHLGAMPMSVTAALARLGELGPGDVAAVNDPFEGGTHLPDITLVAPVYVGEGSAPGADAGDEGRTGGGAEPPERANDGIRTGSREDASGGDADATRSGPLAYLAARAHHADVGGMTPGSMPLARDIHQEGLRIPPVRLVAGGRRVEDVRALVLANVRTPEERAGDLDAQIAALGTGERRLRELVERRDAAEVAAAMRALGEYGDRLVRAGIARIPDGEYRAQDVMEDDGVGGGERVIRVRLAVEGERLTVDFAGTSEQAPGGINAVAAITSSCVRYVVRCVVESLLGQRLPAGGGEMTAVEVNAPAGTIVAARAPASVAAGNVETSQRIADVLLRGFAEALPDRIPAQSQGTMNNVTIGGTDPRTGRSFAYYETVAGGMGGGPSGPGLSGVHVHMTNSLNTPVEALEHAYPLRVRRYRLRAGTGGAGKHRGGDGVVRRVRTLVDANFGLLTERRTHAPEGAQGGGKGRPGLNQIRFTDGDAETQDAKGQGQLLAGEAIDIRTPGAGGWGR
ncbi:MAG: hydantoinase B/oxoprolinase family protein [Gemmatimonadota bacterium]